MDDPVGLAAMEPANGDAPLYNDAPLSVLSVAYCDDAFFG